jgi:hypothetical protein
MVCDPLAASAVTIPAIGRQVITPPVIPLWVKLAYSAFMAVLVPFYVTS